MSATEAIPYEELGRPISGPRALTSDWNRFWHLTFNIARIQWKLRFFGSALGYLWQLMRPLLLFTVLYTFFTVIGHVGRGANARLGEPEHFYGVQLLSSIVLFTFFSECTVGAVASVVSQEAVVRKVQFPRLVIPLSMVLGAVFNLGLNLLVVLIFALFSGVRPMLTWLELPVILFVLAVFSTGLAMLLSALYVYFRDIQPIWDVLTQVIFYASPVIVPLSSVQAKLSHTLVEVYMLNPLASTFQQFRHAMVNNATPGIRELMGPVWICGMFAIVAAVFALGFVVFNRSAPYVAENL
ncbi:MAG TPA: ABC transporter permease [Solirubrobacteraceae bacterium]|nr:ABC transporter permease [Solirubrobacteraceae bacterium]